MLGDEALRSALKTALVRSLVYVLSSSLFLPPSSCSLSSLFFCLLSPPLLFSPPHFLLSLSSHSFFTHPSPKRLCANQNRTSQHLGLDIWFYTWLWQKINLRHRVTPKVSIKTIGQAREWLWRWSLPYNLQGNGLVHLTPKEWGSLLMAAREYEPVICANEMYTQQKKTSKLGPHLYQVHPGLEKGSNRFLHCWQY